MVKIVNISVIDNTSISVQAPFENVDCIKHAQLDFTKQASPT